MQIEESSCQTTAAFGSTTSVREQLLLSFQSGKEYRCAFVEEKIKSGLAAQIKAIREQRGETQAAFARTLGKAQSWVARLEDPNQAFPTIPTLLIAANAFDVDLEVRFAPFSQLLDRLSVQTPASLEVPSFEKDCGVSREPSKLDGGIAGNENRPLRGIEARRDAPGGNIVQIDQFRARQIAQPEKDCVGISRQGNDDY